MHAQARSSDPSLPRVEDVELNRDLLVPRRSVAHIKDGRHLELHVEHGSVWLTQDGSTEDVLLEPGDSFRIARDGLTLISACGRTPFALVRIKPSMLVKPPLRSRIAERFWSWWAGLCVETTLRWKL
jgi:hypothetical protein